MLWDIRALMRPALSVIDMIPNVHRSPAQALLRRTVMEGRPLSLRLTREEKELAFHDAHIPLTSPVGARILLMLYKSGHLKLKKPARKSLPALEAYIATEATFRAEVTRILHEDEARRSRETAIIADPSVALPEELTTRLIDRVMTAHLGHGVAGEMQIAGLRCLRSFRQGQPPADGTRMAEIEAEIHWFDGNGNRQPAPPNGQPG
ncbi:hypothetical protein HOY34_06360 [Xinfangfangia sp. D13-10-4-6]|uniref:hypothetical protein n=1 Tax=Pseudogemmobacter hezensis TaxID=2737662 RepID=UPI001556788B|nr:hypothetical protein [Pseudogemmobacter hezensis]NPD14828.1 hypothetical protein [Pseudogemmobacter hezensis]